MGDHAEKKEPFWRPSERTVRVLIKMVREPSLHLDRVKHNFGKLQILGRAGFSRGRGNTQLDEVKGG